VTESGAPRRTDPRGFVVKALMSLVRGALPAGAVLIGTSALTGVMIVFAVAGVSLISFAFAWLKWRRLTYTAGAQDIRVEQGLFSLSARSVPYERIQDVSVEQKLLARLLGVAEVKFETGAGGKEEIVLAYLSLAESERLRALVRERKEGVPVAASAQPDLATDAAPTDVLFTMGNRRLVLFGLFEFSLIVFAVLLGAAQQFDFLIPNGLWEPDNWSQWYHGGETRLAGLGRAAAIVGLLGAVLALVVVGVLTGIARTAARDYRFRLERTPRGFRRRRGLFNKSDVLLPVHRVQAALIRTGLVRRRFGWHALDFISLAQDGAKTPHHSAVPFAQLEEIWPVVRAAGIERPADDAQWQRPSPRPWVSHALFQSLFFAALGIVGGLVMRSGLPLAAGTFGVLSTILLNWLGWRRSRHAIDTRQLYARDGTLAPRLTIAPRVKLQSAEIAQSPFGRWLGYATLKLGVAGGKLDLHGLPLAEAREIRGAVLDSIAAVDFSRLAKGA
jgi:putative membrane protein